MVGDLTTEFRQHAEGLLRNFTGREWLVKEVAAWRDDPEARPFLLIVGEAGIGKSAFAAHLWLQRKMITAAHFCIGGRGSTVDPLRFVESLSDQLAASTEGFREARHQVWEAYRNRPLYIQPTVQADRVYFGGQVIGAEVKPDISGLSPERALDLWLRRPLQVLAQNNCLPPVTLLVDALDEAITYTGKPTILDLLRQCHDFPAQVRWVLTSRYDPEVISSLFGLPYLVLDAAGKENQQDVRRYLEAQREDLLPTAQRWDLDIDEVIRVIAERGEWNFLYIANILPDLRKGRIASPEDLPVGLGGYYTYLLTTRVGSKAWQEWGADLMEVVLALQEPVRVDFLAAILGWGERVTFQRLNVVAQLLDSALLEEELCFRHHWSVAQFLSNREEAKVFWCDLTAGHRRIATHLVRNPDHWTTHNGYAYRHLSQHLIDARMFEELAALVENRTWYEASTYYDSSGRLFATDVARGLEWADAQVLKHGNLQTLPHIVAWSLLYATVRTRATNVPLAALEAMVLLGETDRALRYAALITEPWWQADAYRRIGECLIEQGQKDKARQALHQALTIITQKAHDELFDVHGDPLNSQITLLANMTKALAEVEDKEILRYALAITQRIESDVARARALAAVLLAQTGDTESAITTAQSIRRGEDRARALAAVARALAQEGKQEQAYYVLHQAFAAADHIKSEWRRAEALSDVARALGQIGDKEDLRQAFVIVQDIWNEAHRAESWAVVALALAQTGEKQLAHKALHQALNAVQNIWWRRSRPMILAIVAQAFALVGKEESRYAFRRLLAIAQDLKDEDGDENALAGAAPALAQVGDGRKAFIAIQQIENEWRRAEALADVVQVLVQGRKTETLYDALVIAQHIKSKGSRAFALSAIARALTQVGKRQQARRVLRQALAAAQSIENGGHRTEILADVVRALAQVGDTEDLRQALATIHDIWNEEIGIEALTAVAQALAQLGDKEGLRQALATALHFEDEILGFRAKALASVVPALAQVRDQEGLREALTAARDIEDENDRDRVLAAVAQALAKMRDSQGALTVAQSIQHEGERADTLSAVAQILARTRDSESALTVAQNVDKWYRAFALASVARTLAQIGEEKQAHEALRQTLIAAQNIEYSWRDAKTARAVVKALAQAGDKEGALAVAQYTWDKWLYDDILADSARALAQVGDSEGSVTAAQEIRNKGRRAKVLATVAQALVQAGEEDRARQVLHWAFTAAQDIQNKDDRARVLVTVAKILTQMGEKKQASETLHQAFAAAQDIRDEDERARVLTDVARVFVQVSEGDEARYALRQAFAVIQNIRDEWRRALTLANVVRALAQVGDKEVLHQALGVTQNVKRKWCRIEALIAIAHALIQAREEEQARGILDQAFTAAQDILPPKRRAKSLIAVTQALAQIGGMEVLSQILADAQNIQNNQHRAEILATVAQALAQVGEKDKADKVFEQALAAAQNITLIWDRTQALTVITLALAQAGNSQRALTIAQSIQDSDVLDAVALTLAQKGDSKGALAAIQNIQSDWRRAESLANLAPVLARRGDREALRQAIVVARSIENTDDAIEAVSRALGEVTCDGDIEVAHWTVEAFQWARNRGREEVWRHIEAFAPVLGKLGVIKETWERIQAVERVVVGDDPLADSG